MPVFFFRFEDMTSDPYPVFKKMFEFIFGVETIEGTFIDHRIRKVLEVGKSKAQVYKPRSAGINKNLEKFSKA